MEQKWIGPKFGSIAKGIRRVLPMGVTDYLPIVFGLNYFFLSLR
jgi:hypothetical protein